MRRRILLLVVGMTVLVVLAFAVPLSILIRNNARDDATTAIKREASDASRTIFSYNGTATEAKLAAYLKTLDPTGSVSIQLPDGRTVGTAPPGGSAAVPPLPGGPGGPGGPRGDPAPVPYRGGLLVEQRVPDFTGGAGDYVVRVWASDGELVSGETTPLLLLLGASVLLVVLGIVLGELLTRRIVRPLVDTAATATRLGSGDTTARAPTDGPPEIADVGSALNRLADRIDQLIEDERETLADLSHRLRTPLTVLRLDAESLHDPAEADRVATHVGVLERMLTATIHAARRPQREGRMPSADARAVVAARVEFWSALAEDQGRDGTVDLPDGPLPVRAAAEDLAAAVDALLENVFAHTPEGTDFAVRLEPRPSGARLTVADDGPGLPAEEPVRGRSDRGSSGLGLDIARRCAESSGGVMALGTTPSGGALVTLEFGAP